ncbi:M23 family metallopeptidase [Sphingopyxis sp. PAMC25046]|uniref:M23 family metallopeptidase n=1 Tax=Sphingopyxis sp. PAMC25046 TaxID=2565556 RepID=UPI00109DC6E1|nr:M23 family metallopeptidase [Sphingopyxis sp. PAMC25046]QCB56368.1 M23 family metallopeptidase [Sphingopyxis sp. PAMC25046]
MSGNAAALTMSQAIPLRRGDSGVEQPLGWRDRLAQLDLVPDLGSNIGSTEWWRGLATLTLLCGSAIATFPGVQPLAVGAPALDAADFNEARGQMIVPLAFGGDTGRHMAATDAVRPLTQTPERPQIELTATLGRGDSFARLLERSGVGSSEAQALASRVSDAVPLADIAPGTRIDLILGRRAARTMPRPVEALAMRARFDLRIEMERVGGQLVMRRIPIAVDATPLRIRGRVGDSLYRSARAAGAPPEAIQSYLRVIGRQISVSRDIRSSDEFDIIVDYRRAETGESETGKLLYAGLIRGGKPKLSMLEWNADGRAQWFEASGVGEQRGGMTRPTRGRVTSTFGMRRHPILGYKRMHRGIDFGGGYGAPIYAVSDGVVTIAGRHGGFGNYVKLNHGKGLGTGYGHMSRIAVRSGQRVNRGQVIGYIGSTGLSKGPHLHYELYRNGRAVNPSSVSFVTRALLEGKALAAFRARIRELTSVAPGAALTPIAPKQVEGPKLGSLADVASKRAGGGV